MHFIGTNVLYSGLRKCNCCYQLSIIINYLLDFTTYNRGLLIYFLLHVY